MEIKNNRIVFMGTPEFSAHILEGLIENGYNIVAVVTQPDKIFGRKKELRPCEAKQMALKYNLPVLTPNKIRLEYEEVLSYNPDLIITAAYGQIVPNEILDYPKYKCINTHGSLLPKYRGASPIQSCLINGDDVTGMSLMYMNEKMDEGDIIAINELPINIHDTNASLFKKMSDLALNMLLEYLPKVFAGDIHPVKQEHEKATYSKKLKKEDEFICFNDNVRTVYNHIRGLLDNPGAYFVLNGKKYKLIEVFFTENKVDTVNVFEGLEGKHLNISCLDGYIQVFKIQPEGKNVMDAKSFFNGAGRNLVGLSPETEIK